jgi:hypothetical protein
MADTDTTNTFPEAEVILENPPSPAPPQPMPRRRSPFPAFLGGAVAAAFGFGVAQLVPDGWPIQSTAALETALATQSAALTAAEAEIARLSAEVAAVESRPSVDPETEARLGALESQPAFDAAPLDARLKTVEEDLARIVAMPSDGSAASPAALAAQASALAALQAEVAALKGSSGSAADITAAAEAAAAQLAEAEARAAELRTQAEADARQALSVASLRQLAVALETGGPFEAALAGISGAEIPAILSDNAALGLPTLSDLQAAFPDAARAALDVALRADMGDGWGDRLTSFLRSQTGARSTEPREGDDPDAILSRAEAALGNGLVPEAISLVGTLPEVVQPAMADWNAAAQTYLAGQEALSKLGLAFGVQK